MLYRAAGSSSTTITTAFNDVATNSYYAEAVAWAVANGITQGKGGNTFAPNDVCTRAELVTFLARYEKAEDADSSQFIDVVNGAFYAGPVGWAVSEGITNGKGRINTFKPNDGCTRAEFVTFLYRDFMK